MISIISIGLLIIIEEDNQQFFEELLKASKMHKKTELIGVYTKQAHWEFIMGNTYNGGSQQPLWTHFPVLFSHCLVNGPVFS